MKALRRFVVLAALGSISSALPLGAMEAKPSVKPSLPADALPTIGVDEVKRGQKGYGLSVFAGTEPERFDVEVLGVMRNIRPEMSYILARLTGQGLERSGVIEGMSGSPVFFDGKLAGAVAFSWSFSNDAIAGITPIGTMRQLSGLEAIPLPPAPNPASISWSQLIAPGRGEIPQEFLDQQLDRLRPRLASGASSAVQWSASGFGEGSLSWLRRAVGDVATAGHAAPGAAGTDLSPGRSISAVLVEGDLQMAATGTVTDRYGDQVLAFGHPFLGLGPVRVPMATSEVITILSNQNNSFKIANVGQIVGSLEQDRQAGIQGRMGAMAPMFPMHVRIDGGSGEAQRDFNVRVAELPEFIPLLVGSTLLGSIESATYSNGLQGLDLDARFNLGKHGEIHIRQSFDGDGSGLKAAAYVLTLVALLNGSPYEQVDFDGVEIALKQTREPRTLSLLTATPDRTIVHPGDKVKVRVDFEAFRGAKQRREVTVKLPADLGTGRYSLLVADGMSADGARMALEPRDPQTFEQSLAQLRSLHSKRELVVLGLRSVAGLAVAGAPLPDLPGSVRSLWGAASSAEAQSIKSQVVQEIVQPMDAPLDGLLRIDLDVRRKPAAEGPDEPESEETEVVAKPSSGGAALQAFGGW